VEVGMEVEGQPLLGGLLGQRRLFEVGNRLDVGRVEAVDRRAIYAVVFGLGLPKISKMSISSEKLPSRTWRRIQRGVQPEGVADAGLHRTAAGLEVAALDSLLTFTVAVVNLSYPRTLFRQ